jgi:ubiquinone/menaquinone biosynthesis C-methylase UbiE
MNEIVKEQQKAYESTYGKKGIEGYSCHYTKDPWIRYVRDRRLHKAMKCLTNKLHVEINDIKHWKILVTCGGVGGEGLFFLKLGFESVTVSDFSQTALDICNMIDPRLNTMILDCENIQLEENSYDLVVVQDGLHHLSRPALGLTEMLRVARHSVIILEPHTGIVSKIFGREWENHQGTINYVFRWNDMILKQTTKSYLLSDFTWIKCLNIWNHSFAMEPLVKFFPPRHRVKAAKFLYRILDTLFPFLANQMIGIIIK